MNTVTDSAGTVTIRWWTGEIPAYPYHAAKPAKELFERASSMYVRRCPEPRPARVGCTGFTAELDGPARTLAAAFL